jgi:hypothetical protein
LSQFSFLSRYLFCRSPLPSVASLAEPFAQASATSATVINAVTITSAVNQQASFDHAYLLVGSSVAFRDALTLEDARVNAQAECALTAARIFPSGSRASLAINPVTCNIALVGDVPTPTLTVQHVRVHLAGTRALQLAELTMRTPSATFNRICSPATSVARPAVQLLGPFVYALTRSPAGVVLPLVNASTGGVAFAAELNATMDLSLGAFEVEPNGQRGCAVGESQALLAAGDINQAPRWGQLR